MLQRRDTMDDVELTALALEIMDDLQNLSTIACIDPDDSYIFKLDDDNHQIHSLYSPQSSDDDDDGMVYIAYPTEPITILSKAASNDSLKDILPPIPCSDSLKSPQSMTTINIAGNKKLGIKRWSERHKTVSHSMSPSVPKLNQKNKYKKKVRRNTTKSRETKRMKKKKRKKNKHRKHKSDGLIQINSNDSIFRMDDMNINIHKEPLPYFVKRGNIPFDEAIDDNPFSLVLTPTNTDYDHNTNTTITPRSCIENKTRKNKKNKKKKKKDTSRSIVRPKTEKTRNGRKKKKKVISASCSKTDCMISTTGRIEQK